MARRKRKEQNPLDTPHWRKVIQRLRDQPQNYSEEDAAKIANAIRLGTVRRGTSYRRKRK